MKWLLPFILLGAAVGQVQHAGINLTAQNTTPGVTFTFYGGTTPGGESTTPLVCTPLATGTQQPNQCFFTTGTAGTVYYFYAIGWLNQGGVNIPGAPSVEWTSPPFPTVPAQSTISGAIAVQ